MELNFPPIKPFGFKEEYLIAPKEADEKLLVGQVGNYFLNEIKAGVIKPVDPIRINSIVHNWFGKWPNTYSMDWSKEHWQYILRSIEEHEELTSVSYSKFGPQDSVEFSYLSVVYLKTISSGQLTFEPVEVRIYSHFEETLLLDRLDWKLFEMRLNQFTLGYFHSLLDSIVTGKFSTNESRLVSDIFSMD